MCYASFILVFVVVAEVRKLNSIPTYLIVKDNNDGKDNDSNGKGNGYRTMQMNDEQSRERVIEEVVQNFNKTLRAEAKKGGQGRFLGGDFLKSILQGALMGAIQGGSQAAQQQVAQGFQGGSQGGQEQYAQE